MVIRTDETMKQRLNHEEVCDFLGVTIHALHKWRRPERLTHGADDPLYLPGTPDPDNRNVVWYNFTDLLDFCLRNETYRDRLTAKIARSPVLLMAALHKTANELRQHPHPTDTPPDTTTAADWWKSLSIGQS